MPFVPNWNRAEAKDNFSTFEKYKKTFLLIKYRPSHWIITYLFENESTINIGFIRRWTVAITRRDGPKISPGPTEWKYALNQSRVPGVNPLNLQYRWRLHDSSSDHRLPTMYILIVPYFAKEKSALRPETIVPKAVDVFFNKIFQSDEFRFA